MMTTEVREYIAILHQSIHGDEVAERVHQKLLAAGHKDDDFVPHYFLTGLLNEVLRKRSIEKEQKQGWYPKQFSRRSLELLEPNVREDLIRRFPELALLVEQPAK
ncbi:MAG: hypothetical protein NT026_00845 [Candidatus Staskawiczbacteria bacterium]|nr:hypothetical protein [Candidatus Staskawiczbacteria bacterium]